MNEENLQHSSQSLETNSSYSFENQSKVIHEKIEENKNYFHNLIQNLTLNENSKKEVKDLFKDDLENSIKTLRESIKSEGQEIKKDFITFFGLFASFVTFFSIEVQIFKNNDNLNQLIGICCLTLSFILFFAISIYNLSKIKEEREGFKSPLIYINLIIMLIGVICLFFGENNIKERFYILNQKLVSDSVEITNCNKEINLLKQMLNQQKDTLSKYKTFVINEDSIK